MVCGVSPPRSVRSVHPQAARGARRGRLGRALDIGSGKRKCGRGGVGARPIGHSPIAPRQETTVISTTRPETAEVSLLLTDIEDSTRLWEQHPDFMSIALVRHEAL